MLSYESYSYRDELVWACVSTRPHILTSQRSAPLPRDRSAPLRYGRRCLREVGGDSIRRGPGRRLGQQGSGRARPRRSARGFVDHGGQGPRRLRIPQASRDIRRRHPARREDLRRPALVRTIFPGHDAQRGPEVRPRRLHRVLTAQRRVGLVGVLGPVPTRRRREGRPSRPPRQAAGAFANRLHPRPQPRGPRLRACARAAAVR